MEEKLIEAKPFIYQFTRIDTLDISGMEAIGLKEDSQKALNQPFNPEEIPDVLEGWEWNGINNHRRLTSELRSMRGKVLFSESVHYRNFDEEEQYYTGLIPQTLNDFLSDLHRAGIKAHFSPEWIKKNGLK